MKTKDEETGNRKEKREKRKKTEKIISHRAPRGHREGKS